MAIVNRRARHEYHILENLETGMILTGPEVKSIRQGLANLAEAHCIIRNGRMLLIGCHISPYKPAAMNNPHDPTRSRQLLLNKRELERLVGRLKESGLTIVPLKLYFNARGFAKLEVGLARGKKMHDKRAATKERDVKRDLQRSYKM
ncbi:MAG: SsrA-binding protein [Zetaproteobacteria bacterium CG12_big_fil_rev_8_21_14_0_65_54_13]|nr:MAG: SsrA-binding protein [Zetaproteobacteria bacterium CG23_combo_of_CG06-09_8_20_14_all_54_7]PIW51539.1 MAG: SsrA-binding protein [Zetaproteobacteria bacterium CG12_big_fil_rev_8_21_14_0_65_54_13]PIX53617.1 MAG: SsrA-binding protein [Zetaproteobacteria bacterium CG_4_10_14_3_um_filter_54_28]PJA27925.1 MAG: SsrA-binding protein [Zetaproteobacteria bacterium CG_4_9_14_3_um_filter_54_145]